MKQKQEHDSKIVSHSLFAITIVITVSIVIVLNVILWVLAKNTPSFTRDLTQNKLFQLSQSTTQMLDKISLPVEIKVLAKEETFAGVSSYNQQANEIFHQFQRNSKNITLSYVDYIKDPTFSSAYPDLTIKHGDVLVSSGDEYHLVATQELFNYSQGANGNPIIASSKAEQAIAEAIIQVISTEKTEIAVITGHEEYKMESFEALLASNGYNITMQNLVTDSIPAQTSIVMILSPKTDFTEAELKKLDAFLNNNGSYGKLMFYAADADQPPLPNLELFLKEWGVEIGDGAVFETKENRVYNYHPFFAKVEFAEEYFAGLLSDPQKPMILPVSRPLKLIYENRNQNSTQTLLEFQQTAGVRPPDATENFTSDDATQWGPIPGMVLASYRTKEATTEKQSHILVSGSVAMLDTDIIENYSLNNWEYTLNLFSSISQTESLFYIPPKTFVGQDLGISSTTANTMGTVFMMGIPAIIVVLGLLVWRRRKRR